MRIAVILVTVTFLAIISVSTADTLHSAGHHHVVKHVTHQAESAHGDAKKGSKHSQHKHAKKSGKTSKHEEEEGKKGAKEVVKHVVEDEEGAGKKINTHTEDSHQSHKKSGAHSAHGAKFKAGAKQKKFHYSKGFREQYHKDEHKKHDSFYSNDHKTGEYKLFGGKDQKYHTQHFNKDSHGKYVAKKHGDKYGKDGKSGHGFKVANHKGFEAENGNNKHYMKHNKWAKKNDKKHQVGVGHAGLATLKK